MSTRREDNIVEAMARAACLDEDPDEIVAIGFEEEAGTIKAKRGPRWQAYSRGARRQYRAHLAMLKFQRDYPWDWNMET